VLHSLTLVCRVHKQELNTLKLELNGYGRRPIAALIKLIFPIVYAFQENIIGYFSGPAKVRAPKKTPKASGFSRIMMLAPPKGNAALRKEQKNTFTEPLQAEEKLACKSVVMNK